MKITLMDIMESLSGDNVDDAQAALHEWFVGKAEEVHSNMRSQVTESDDEEEDKIEESTEEQDDEDDKVEESAEADDAGEKDLDESLMIEAGDLMSYERNGIPNELHNDDDIQKAIKMNALRPDTIVRIQANGAKPIVKKASEVPGIAKFFPATPTFEELVAELSESFQGLETVSDKLQNVEGAQVGEQGKVPVNTKPTLPSKKGDKRLGGDPVEVKATEHKGHALEKAPKVVDVKVHGNVQNSKDDPKNVADKGDSSALLNKVDGSVNTQSPISGKGAKGLKK